MGMVKVKGKGAEKPYHKLIFKKKEKRRGMEEKSATHFAQI